MKVILTPELIGRFASYQEDSTVQGCVHYGEWGSLHIVLADGNTEKSSATFCREWSQKIGDREGEQLAGLMEQMSGSQRGRISRKVREYNERKVCI